MPLNLTVKKIKDTVRYQIDGYLGLIAWGPEGCLRHYPHISWVGNLKVIDFTTIFTRMRFN